MYVIRLVIDDSYFSHLANGYTVRLALTENKGLGTVIS